jgi:hypothetical protein
MGSGNFRDISYICLQQDILVTSQGFISPVSFFFVLGGGPWLEGRCLETKRILAYAEFLFRENDLSGTKWGVRRVLFRLKRFRGTKCIRLKVLFHMSVFPERNHRG